MKLKSNLVQGSQEWLDYRMNKLGASDATIIMGVSPWSTPHKLWQVKLGITVIEQNDAMRRGHELEPMIRKEFEDRFGVEIPPAIVEHPVIPYMMSSLDGLNQEKKIAVEIKTANAKDHALVKEGKVPEKYYPQLQHQLACLEYKEVYYFSYHKEDFAHVIVQRDDEYIQKLYKEEEAFYKCMMDMTPPVLTEADYVERHDDFWNINASAYQDAIRKMKFWADKAEDFKLSLVDDCKGQSSKGCGITVRSFPESKGSINYKAIPELKGVDLEQYRGRKKAYWRITNDSPTETASLF